MSVFVSANTTTNNPKTKTIMPKGAFLSAFVALWGDLRHKIKSKMSARIRQLTLKGKEKWREMKKLPTKSPKSPR